MYTENKIMSQTSQYVGELLSNQLPIGHIFHNLDHTQTVVQAAREISEALSIPKGEQEIILLAAWFHDCGHIIICDGHEEESKLIAEQFLRKVYYPESKISKVLQCIEATKLPQRPVDLLGEILCDADLYHLAASNYFKLLGQLRAEWAQIRNENYTDKDWFHLNLNFLLEHRYFTEYGRGVLEDRKQSTIEALERYCELFE